MTTKDDVWFPDVEIVLENPKGLTVAFCAVLLSHPFLILFSQAFCSGPQQLKFPLEPTELT